MPLLNWTQAHKQRIVFLAAFLGMVSILLGLIMRDILNGNPQFPSPVRTTPVTVVQTKGVQSGASVSPLLFGTNLALFGSNDQFLKSSATRARLQQMRIRIVRMPVRSTLSDATEIQAAEGIKSIGAIPLVILRGAVDDQVLSDDTRIVNDMNRIFGNSIVYYEYGNEEDLLGVNVTRYTTSWNSIIPQLKRVALQGHFIGPVNYHFDREYLSAFLKNANPRPDEVSWHEYTCDDSWASDICLSHIDHWTNHINDARSAMNAAIGRVLPIMITEWNYAPNAVSNDGKNNNSNFMSIWTTKALQTLATNRIFASMQYSCTDTAIPLLTNSSTLTTQGTSILQQYQQMIVDGQQPGPTSGQPPNPESTPPIATPNPGSTATLNSYQSFSFEDGNTDGWSGHGSQVVNVQNSTAFAFDGKHALHVTFTNIDNSDYPYISVSGATLANSPQVGQQLSAYVYPTSSSANLAAKVFVMDSGYHWLSSGTMTSLTPGKWTHLTFTLTSNVNGPVRLLGIQFTNVSSNPTGGEVFIDAVSWN